MNDYSKQKGMIILKKALILKKVVFQGKATQGEILIEGLGILRSNMS